MAKKRVSPNRMELMNLEKRLGVATRGHKLLKDKRDGLMRVFMERIENVVKLRQDVDESLAEATSAMAKAEAVLGTRELGEALLLNAETLKVTVDEENIMSLSVPKFNISFEQNNNSDKGFPFGLASTSSEIDAAIEILQKAFPSILELAAAEKAIQMMAEEIETTRRRVNSLEFFMIPEMQASIKEISMKMEEAERDNTIKLMKVKDEIAEDTLQESRKETERQINAYKSSLEQ